MHESDRNRPLLPIPTSSPNIFSLMSHVHKTQEHAKRENDDAKMMRRLMIVMSRWWGWRRRRERPSHRLSSRHLLLLVLLILAHTLMTQKTELHCLLSLPISFSVNFSTATILRRVAHGFKSWRISSQIHPASINLIHIESPNHRYKWWWFIFSYSFFLLLFLTKPRILKLSLQVITRGSTWNSSSTMSTNSRSNCW